MLKSQPLVLEQRLVFPSTRKVARCGLPRNTLKSYQISSSSLEPFHGQGRACRGDRRCTINARPADNQPSARPKSVSFADTACDHWTPAPKSNVPVLDEGVAHGRPPDSDAPSPRARSPRASDCAVEVFGALPRPPERGGNIHRHANWADIGIDDSSTGRDVSTADHAAASDTSNGQSAEVPRARRKNN